MFWDRPIQLWTNSPSAAGVRVNAPLASLDPVDVEPADAGCRERHRELCPLADGHLGAAGDLLLVTAAEVGDGETRASAVFRGQGQVRSWISCRSGRSWRRSEPPVRFSGNGDREVGDAIEDARWQQDVLVRVRVTEPHRPAGPARHPTHLPPVECPLALAQLLDEVVELVDEDLLARARVGLGEQRHEVPGETPAQQVPGVSQTARPGPGSGQAGIDAEEMQHPVGAVEDASRAGVVPCVVEHPVALLPEDAVAQRHLIEGERLDRPVRPDPAGPGALPSVAGPAPARAPWAAVAGRTDATGSGPRRPTRPGAGRFGEETACSSHAPTACGGGAGRPHRRNGYVPEEYSSEISVGDSARSQTCT